MDEDKKKVFLQQSSSLYDEMIKLTDNDVIRRYLAFRIIVNTMSFEDLVGKRQHLRMRKIRDVLLAHKQEPEFFEGYRGSDDVTNQSIGPLLAFMSLETGLVDPADALSELKDGPAKTKFDDLLPQVFALYEKDHLTGYRLTNNFLCFTGENVQEVTAGPLAGVFYRYHSSKALFELAQYVYNNTRTQPELVSTASHAKLDMLLHAQNMADCAVKDTHNRHSIDGLLEVMTTEAIGDATSLQALISSARYQLVYSRVRQVRNKLIGHMDKAASLADLIAALNALATTDIHDLVNLVDKAVYDASSSHIAIRTRYQSYNQKLNDPLIMKIAGLAPRPYF